MKLILRILFFVSFVSFSQVGGESVYNFLNVPTSARQAALGGKVITLLDDVNQPLWNPATINIDLENQLAVNYLNYLTDIGYASVSYAYLVNRNFGVVQGGLTYANYGEFIEADETGIETGTFKAYDLALSIGYAYQVPFSNFSIGVNAKLINSVIQDYSSFGIATDLGIVYENDHQPYVFSLAIRNIGYQITTFDGEQEKVPLEILFGASYRLKNVPVRWYVTLDNLQKWNVAKPNPSNSFTDINGTVIEEEINFLDNTMRHFVVGAEFFPESLFNLRLGYNFRRAKELKLADARTFAGFSAGFGLQMRRVKLNYAFTKYHPAENTSTFSLQIDLSGR
ncbi:type IX secretion system protein PorQ [Urechidicola croceus]|uniref:Penicillin-binding protein n=1 Tax=Urechidicola croceus TaxID=1850246 RepID=A0A1D8P3X6_9FLAO|nr:type IX secretion system protein PorQ [Urechidicola croceus]AOW19282.1 penicillin-binding protein [Urechidicola croceus]